MKNQILEKFESIGFLDYKEVISDLENYSSLEEKLNYLKDIKTNFYDKQTKIRQTLSMEELLFIKDHWSDCENDDFILCQIFGAIKLVTPLKIQEPVFTKYFQDNSTDPEFTFWFMKYNSETRFKLHIDSEDFKRYDDSELRQDYLRRDLDQILEEEAKAKKLLATNKIDVFSDYRIGEGKMWAFNQNIYSIEVLRILDGNYYKKNATTTLNGNSNEVQAYFRHKLLKPFLLNELGIYSSSSCTKMELAKEQDIIEENIKLALKKIYPLSGYWDRNIILNQVDYERLTNYVTRIIKNRELPTNAKNFPITGATNSFIRKTIHNVYLELGKKNKSAWVDLVHKFSQFKSTEKNTTFIKFSTYSSIYENDLKNMITYR